MSTTTRLISGFKIQSDPTVPSHVVVMVFSRSTRKLLHFLVTNAYDEDAIDSLLDALERTAMNAYHGPWRGIVRFEE